MARFSGLILHKVRESPNGIRRDEATRRRLFAVHTGNVQHSSRSVVFEIDDDDSHNVTGKYIRDAVFDREWYQKTVLLINEINDRREVIQTANNLKILQEIFKVFPNYISVNDEEISLDDMMQKLQKIQDRHETTDSFYRLPKGFSNEMCRQIRELHLLCKRRFKALICKPAFQ